MCKTRFRIFNGSQREQTNIWGEKKQNFKDAGSLFACITLLYMILSTPVASQLNASLAYPSLFVIISYFEFRVDANECCTNFLGLHTDKPFYLKRWAPLKCPILFHAYMILRFVLAQDCIKCIYIYLNECSSVRIKSVWIWLKRMWNLYTQSFYQANKVNTRETFH